MRISPFPPILFLVVLKASWLEASDDYRFYVKIGKSRTSASVEIQKDSTLALSRSCALVETIEFRRRFECGKKRAPEVVKVLFQTPENRAVLILRDRIITKGKTQLFACRKSLDERTKTIFKCLVEKPNTGGRGGLLSPFPSTVAEVSIPNSYQMSPYIFRGMMPKIASDYHELVHDLGIREFILFKLQTGNENDLEVEQLKNQVDGEGQPIIFEGHIHDDLPFRYHEFEDFATPCRQIVRALKIVSRAEIEKRKLYFHCTVGEDRTGLLGGLYHMSHGKKDIREVFKREMCEKGYSSGNPWKPYLAVVRPIRAELTPLFVKMAYLLSTTSPETGELICEHEPEYETAKSYFKIPDLRCDTSTRFWPWKAD